MANMGILMLFGLFGRGKEGEKGKQSKAEEREGKPFVVRWGVRQNSRKVARDWRRALWGSMVFLS